MMSLLLDSTKDSAWDLVVTEGELQIVSDDDYTTQKIKQVLLTTRGEYFRNADVGIPWFQDILGVKNPDIASIKTLITDAILKNEILIGLGVTAVDITDVIINKRSRSMSMTLNITAGGTNTTTEFTL